MTLTELSRRTGLTMANLSTLTAIFDVLDTTPAELITIRPRYINSSEASAPAR